MHKFVGFDVGANTERGQRLTGVPASFFTELLPQITNISELKVTLHFIYLAGRKRGEPKWVGYWELEASQDLLQGLRRGGDPRPPQEHLREGLELAIARGTLLRILASSAPREYFEQPFGGELEPVDNSLTTWFLLNTASNREFVRKVESGEVALENTTLVHGLDLWDFPLTLPDRKEGDTAKASPASQKVDKWVEQRWQVQTQRTDIYTLFEQNIATLTPLISEQLREAEQLYPPEWIVDAFSEAVSYNRRNWRYIARILENWAIEGRRGYAEQERGQKQNGRFKQSEPGQFEQGYSQSQRDAGTRPGTQRRSDVGADGTGTPDESRVQPAPVQGTRRPAAPGQLAGPIDFTKYTTGKYAYLTQRDEPPVPPKSESERK
jgi:DnaD/phage-associated family protein